MNLSLFLLYIKINNLLFKFVLHSDKYSLHYLSQKRLLNPHSIYSLSCLNKSSKLKKNSLLLYLEMILIYIILRGSSYYILQILLIPIRLKLIWMFSFLWYKFNFNVVVSALTKQYTLLWTMPLRKCPVYMFSPDSQSWDYSRTPHETTCLRLQNSTVELLKVTKINQSLIKTWLFMNININLVY